MANKTHLALLFGGDSSEHDVSKRSAHNIYDAMDKEKYDISLFLLTKKGIILSNEASHRVFNGEPEDDVVKEEMSKLDFSDPLAPIKNLSEVKDIDVFFPIIHGNLGEDGTIQGLLRLLHKPYVGSGILESAMGFDKDITKKMLNLANVRNTNYQLITPDNKDEWSYAKLQAKFGDVIFLKPANQGSSVGIHKITNEQEFEDGLKDAFRYDYKILAEQSINGPEELEISILGNEKPIASKLGAIRVPKQDKFYTYDNKFVDASQVIFDIPVDVSTELSDEITDMALRAYKALGLKGMARIDFLVSKDDVPYLGEVNTLPGFTNISLYPQLWESSGISYTELIDRLIDLAYAEFDRQANIIHDFKPLS
ncbi:D-alanine--D-alanine ligase family protein [Apilactobacillus micheneri]|uniref:D-alanine--D-alanine ligase n=1 Tax=Apilactobacillus micheneri TaxID=1899430 RepID=A0A9Q8MTJ1_9LACO|nr:D-alanine--D-alanine ligase family protein [Apilactobacillus micheneri]TPR39364.1 D-alanine--D-alanine ligase [Apilactobacillus micheneri]TPR41566.1 D-alanine--D-alanine ligase [Apilactobacillus micheneri]TPR43469.1 D-alanine--D-alanine ligase [Apilactobacillus micheneri]TPR44378.1 D-alanine--D-alanine ligase [Apilactobacillus micheneri]TPR44586.1 D-alanine--D-alanine ligase [Apilactobacillus micheneri]